MPNTSAMPHIRLGSYSISRLVLGSNPVNAISHNSTFLDKQMERYFTQRRVLELLAQAERLGVNAWQATSRNLDDYRAHREEGGHLHLIVLANDSPKDPDVIQRAVASGAIAIAHHGGVTDRLWREGKIEEVHDFCRRVRDSGVMVGVSMHNPVVLDHVMSNGWDVDFFMCCLYELTRTREQVHDLLRDVPIPYQKLFLESDPPRMLAAVRRAGKPCLAFKLLAAGRLCDSQAAVEGAFESTLRGLPPHDGVIVGMYPEYENQAALDVGYMLKHNHLSDAVNSA